MTYKKGIDVSDNQGTIDWETAKCGGVEFAILRSVRGSGKPDNQFAQNVLGCRTARVPFDVYKYTYATTVDKGTAEASKVVALLQKYSIKDCTVWWDLEDARVRQLGKKSITAITKAARTVIEAGGYNFGIYCNLDWYRNVLEVEAFNCPFWVARYPSNAQMYLQSNPEASKRPSINHVLFGWQYSSKGYVPGIKGNVDLNEIYQNDVEVDGSEEAGERNPYQEPNYSLYRGRLAQSREHVRWLQWHLVRLGYLPEVDSEGNGNIDGYFGKDTEAAFLQFQQAHPETYFTSLPDKHCGLASRKVLKSL